MNKGQSLFEVVVSIAISALVIVALVALVSGGIRNADFAKNNSLAGVYAQQATEWLRGQRDTNIASFITYATNSEDPTSPAVWCLPVLSWSQPSVSQACQPENVDNYIFGTSLLRQVTFNIGTEDSKTIIDTDVSVSWTDAQGLHEVKSTTKFSDWRER